MSAGLMRRDPRRGELDGQRDPVEPPADLAPPPARVTASSANPRAHRRRPLDEQAHRVAAARSSGAVARRQRRATGPQPPARRARRAPRGSSPAPARPGTRRSDRVRRGRPRRRGGARSCRARAAARGRAQALRPRSSASDRPWRWQDAQGRRHDLDHRVGVGRPAASSHEPRAVGELAAAPRAATCSARRVLPTPPTPVSVTSRAFVEHLDDRGDARRRARRTTSPARAGSPANASSDRSGGNSRRARGARPGTPARAAPGRAAGARRGRPARRRRPATSSCRGRRHHDLAAVRDRHEPRRPVHRGAVVVAVAQLGRDRVWSPIRTRSGAGRGPRLRAQRGLGRRPRRRRRRARSANAAWNPSPVVFTTCAAVRLDRGAHDLVVARQRRPHRLGMLLPQARRTLEVGEQERHRPRRQHRQSAPSSRRG